MSQSDFCGFKVNLIYIVRPYVKQTSKQANTERTKRERGEEVRRERRGKVRRRWS